MMELIQDRRFDFRGYHGSKAHCRIRAYRGRDGQFVVVATELPTNQGTSITNACETLAAEVCTRLEIDPTAMRWVEHYTAGPHRDGAESFDVVTFIPSAGRREHGLGQPKWRRVSKAVVEDMIGQAIGD